MGRIRAAIWMLAGALGVLGLGVMGLGAARAAGPACTVPGLLPAPHEEGPSDREPQRVLPIGSYTLSVIWMPQKCRKGDEVDCALYRQTSKSGRRDGLTLHGLWPDGKAEAWPQWCKPSPVLSQKVVADHICATPSPQLLQHEWTKHGTCMAGYTPERYFDQSNKLFAAFRAPNLRALSYSRQTARSVATAVARANPGMTADMMRLNIDKQGWLQEIWLCLDTSFRPIVCPATQGGAKGDEKVLIWRGGRTGGWYSGYGRY